MDYIFTDEKEIEVSTASWKQDRNGNMTLEITKLKIYPYLECDELNPKLEFHWFQICTRPINLHIRYHVNIIIAFHTLLQRIIG